VPFDDLGEVRHAGATGVSEEGGKSSLRIAPAPRGCVRSAAALACLIALGNCGDDVPEVKTGKWGGLGTELNVTGSGASVLLCCNATGAIQAPLVPDASGHFKAAGTVFQEGLRADYEGTVSGDSLQLRITYAPTDPAGFVINGPGAREPRPRAIEPDPPGSRWHSANEPGNEGTTGRAFSYVVLLMLALVALRLAIRVWPSAHADSAEYLLTAESLFNHGTPNVHPADLLSWGWIAARSPLQGDYGAPLSHHVPAPDRPASPRAHAGSSRPSS
jgi:hypothetical protein